MQNIHALFQGVDPVAHDLYQTFRIDLSLKVFYVINERKSNPNQGYFASKYYINLSSTQYLMEEYLLGKFTGHVIVGIQCFFCKKKFFMEEIKR